MPELQPGRTYKLTNVESKTIVDLSGGDNKSVIGFTYHDGANQKWILDRHDSNWTLKNAASGLFLGFEGNPENGTPVVASQHLFTWHIEEEGQGVYRLFVPNTKFNLDMSDHGNPAPGTLVTLWGKWGGKNQLWHFDEV